MSNMKDYDMIIVGAGITGMTLAYELSKYFSKILLIEKESDIGGAVSSYAIDGFSIEKYYHHFFTQDLELLNLIKDLQLSGEVIWQNAPVGYYLGGEIFALNSPLDILSYRYLSLSDKIKLGIALLKLKSQHDFLHLDHLTAKEWIIANTSVRVYENFFRPLLNAKFGKDLDISAAWLCARIRKRANKNFEGEKLGYFKGGFRILFEAIKQKMGKGVTILRSTEVDKVITANNMVEGVLARGANYSSDNVIITTGSKTALRLCDFPYQEREKLKKINDQCVICCLIGLKRSLIPLYWLNIGSEGLPFGVLIEHNNFVNFEEYKNTRLLYVITYCANENDAFFKMQDEEIFSKYSGALEGEFSLKKEDLLWYRISRSSEAGPVYTKGILNYLPEIQSGIRGLYLAGMIRSFPDRGINESIKDAEYCAKIIAGK